MKKARFLILGGVILSALIYLMYVGIQTGSMYYLSVSEFMSQKESLKGRKVRVNGELLVGSVNYDPKGLELRFALKDDKTGHTLQVVYHGAPPDLLEREGVSVVAEGVYDERTDTFKADQLLVKCPSKYERKGTPEGPGSKEVRT